MNTIKNILKIAHRGYSPASKSRENTLFAFKNAVEHKFNMIELDVQHCKSDEIVIHHDTHIPYDGKLTPIIDISLDDLQRSNPYLITLQHFIETIDISKEMKLYIDIKGNTNTIIQPLIDLLYYNYSTFQNIILCSFNNNHLVEIERHNEDLTRENEYYINKGFITENIYLLSELEILLKNKEYLITYWSMLDKDTINYCKKKNIKVFCYTAKSDDILDYIKQYDIDGIVSDIKI
jgi:glycerophosphoryl diester phosphodiesterase